MFRLRAYGGLTLERDGSPYTGPATQRRRLAVLAMLAASDTGVSRDRLVDYLWSDADPARARHSLDEALSGLRREFRSDDLFVGVASLRLNRDVLASDLADQSAAVAAGDTERAAALYAGPFLDGFYIPGAADFEHWVEAERSARARAHARVLEGLAAAATTRGDSATAVQWWQARVALDALDTPATLNLLTALIAAGNSTEALRLARVHEALVRQELETSPGPGWAAAIDGLRAELAREPVAASVQMSSSADAQPAPAALDAPVIERLPMEEQHATLRPLRGTTLLFAPAALARSPRTLILGGVAILLVGLALQNVWSRRVAARPVAVTAPVRSIAERASVAVLPFANTGGSPADEPFSDGLTDELIGALSRVSGVRVTGRTSAFALKGRGLTVRTIADTLGVATVLEGSVRRDGDRLKITVQLVSASDNGVLWSETYDREPKDVFAVQEEIARAIVGALAPTLGGKPVQLRSVQPRDLATYELYLKGRFFLGLRTPNDLRRAEGYFEQAVARDPAYAQAYAGMADARVLLVLLADSPPREAIPRARAAAASAIRLDSTVAEAHAALGNIREAFDWDAAGAEQELARAVALDPGYATARLYWGIHLLNRGRFDEAVSELTKARMLDPLSAPVRMQLGRAYVSARRPDEAVALLRTAVELNPEFPAAHLQLGDAYLTQGKSAEALSAFRRAAALSGVRDSAHLAYALASTGQRLAAESVLAALLTAPKPHYLPPVPMAKAYVALKDHDAAFRWLERGYVDRAAQMRTIKVSPAFDAVRTDPRWTGLLRRIGLEP